MGGDGGGAAVRVITIGWTPSPLYQTLSIHPIVPLPLSFSLSFFHPTPFSPMFSQSSLSKPSCSLPLPLVTPPVISPSIPPPSSLCPSTFFTLPLFLPPHSAPLFLSLSPSPSVSLPLFLSLRPSPYSASFVVYPCFVILFPSFTLT